MGGDLIYVIDDDKANTFLNQIMLAEVGLHHLQTFSMVQPALDELKRVCAEGDEAKYPAIILLDINLPVKSGWDFLDEVRNIPCPFSRQVKVFITSSSDHPRDVDKAKTYPEVIEFLPKPMTEDLATRLRDEYIRV